MMLSGETSKNVKMIASEMLSVGEMMLRRSQFIKIKNNNDMSQHVDLATFKGEIF